MSRNPTKNIDYTSRDYEAFRELLIQKLQEKMPEYTDTSETDAGIVILEALANGLDVLSLYLDLIANDTILTTTQDRSMAIVIAKCLGYTPYNQTASEYPQVFVLNGVRDTDTLIPKGTIVKTVQTADLATLYYETQEDLIIPAGDLGDEKDENDEYIHTVIVKHGTSVKQDVIGSSTGSPLQNFRLHYTGVLTDSIQLYVNEGTGEELWKQVDSFIDSDSSSKVFAVSVDDFDVCTIVFGNGVKGKIPNAYPNGIIADYRIGGGEAGNVNANIITVLESSVAYVKETFNLSATVLGHEKESLESIKINAPAMFRSKDRIVTLQDFEDVLRINFYDFLALKAVKDDLDVFKTHVYYMMKPDYSMTLALEEAVEECVEQKGMIGYRCALHEYVPQVVNISATMYVDKDYDKDEIATNVQTYLEGVTFYYGELLFGDSIVKSDLESEIKNTFAEILSFRINSPSGDFIAPTEAQNILTLGTVNITSQYL